jgi:hypothetical protein
VSWSNEDYLRSERESTAYENDIAMFLDNIDLLNWFQVEHRMYESTIAPMLEATIVSCHIDLRDRAKFALRQLTALSEEAREEAIKLTDDDEGPVEPPGHTCFEIDRAQRVMRQLVWRANNPGRALKKDTAALLAEGLGYLEAVRDENKQMRAAHAHATRKVKS